MLLLRCVVLPTDGGRFDFAKFLLCLITLIRFAYPNDSFCTFNPEYRNIHYFFEQMFTGPGKPRFRVRFCGNFVTRNLPCGIFPRIPCSRDRPMSIIDSAESPDSWGRGLYCSPLVPVATLFTFGIFLERWLVLPFAVSAAILFGALMAWAVTLVGGPYRLGLMYLALGVVALGALRYHLATRVLAENDIAHVVSDRPVSMQVRGWLSQEPVFFPADEDVLRSRPGEAMTRSDLAIEAARQGGEWLPASGRVRLYLAGRADGLHVGDRIEATGSLLGLEKAANPGEFDRVGLFEERGLHGRFFVANLPGAWRRLEPGRPTLAGQLAILRGDGQATLAAFLPASTAPLAMTLLLGEGAPLTRADWDRYLRTGIIAVLAISGQHLLILGAFLNLAGRLLGWRQRGRVTGVALLLFGYALLTGGRPAAMRAAFVVLTLAFAVLLRRRIRAVSCLALAWLVIGLLDPADLFTPGCLFSFLAVAVLIALPVRYPEPSTDPLDRLLAESEPPLWRLLRPLVRGAVRAYLTMTLLWLLLTPLAIGQNHLISPVGILLGPPLTLLATAALFLGFLLLLLAPLVPLPGLLLAGPLDLVLRLMHLLIDWGDGLPGAWFFVPGPGWIAIVAFYAGLLLATGLPWPRARWRGLAILGATWPGLVLILPGRSVPGDEFRATFLSVGHGSCVVLECPDGRVALYDAGSLRGPATAAQQIAPYLWWRGIGRIDEVFLSHGDLDHFNALPALLERFVVGRVCTIPSFVAKATPAVQTLLARLQVAGVEVRPLHVGMKLHAGTMTLEVLHPPRRGPEGPENVRSLVLRANLGARSLLLTGDLESIGLEMLLQTEPRRCEVVMFPHHGSKRLDPTALVYWTGAEWLIACQGATTTRGAAMPDAIAGARIQSTHAHGAITCRATPGGWEVESFRSPNPAWLTWAEAMPDR